MQYTAFINTAAVSVYEMLVLKQNMLVSICWLPASLHFLQMPSSIAQMTGCGIVFAATGKCMHLSLHDTMCLGRGTPHMTSRYVHVHVHVQCMMPHMVLYGT